MVVAKKVGKGDRELFYTAKVQFSSTLMIGKVLWEEFFSNRDWTVASAVAIILLLILIIPIVLFQRNEQKQRETLK